MAALRKTTHLKMATANGVAAEVRSGADDHG